MKRLALLLLLTGCGPMQPSIPKYSLCSIPSDYQSQYDSVILGDSWNDVKTKMNDTPTERGDTQVYRNCKEFVFTFTGSVLVSKQIK